MAATLNLDTKLVGILKAQKASTKYTKESTESGVQEMEFDFSETTVGELIDLSIDTLVIKRQRVLRGFETEALMLKHCRENPKETILARDAGKSGSRKPRTLADLKASIKEDTEGMTREEKIAHLESIGLL